MFFYFFFFFFFFSSRRRHTIWTGDWSSDVCSSDLPGLVLPLHIFEERYRQLVRDLLEGPEPQEFGVIAIRKGRETGVDGVSALYEIGCAAALRQVARHDDGRFDVVTVGTQRFRL